MTPRIEDYGLIGDLQTAALVSRTGSIDWLCLPRFDASACFARLLGRREHGFWELGPVGEVRAAKRRYRDDSLILETELESDEGAIRIVDFMPPRERQPDVVRIVEGLRGRPRVRSELCLRFDYGSITPWFRRLDGDVLALGGPDAVTVRADVPLEAHDGSLVSELTLAEGERAAFVLTWFPSAEDPPDAVDPDAALRQTEEYWTRWTGRFRGDGPYRDAVVRSLVTLKALTYGPTGGLIASPTTSLPEELGGVRNWDYRFCWIRDSAFVLDALLDAGYREEAERWRDWLVRAVAGDPHDFQVMYGVAGERRLPEYELPWLPGFAGSSPVRCGNLAHEQHQLDVYGELIDTIHEAREADIPPDEDAWELQRRLMDVLEERWREPDKGIWEIRGPERHFTHSKVMAWVAFDRAAQAVERFGLEGPADRWRALATEVHEQVCREGFDEELGAFVQSYGSKELDAALLLLPLVGFLPPEDPRVRGTVEAVQRELVEDGFVRRYRADAERIDGVPGSEATFLPASFWLVEALTLIGERDEAAAQLDRLLGIRNDLGLLAEQYDPREGRLLGNFPQAFSHVGLVTAVACLEERAVRQARPGDA